MASFDLLSPTVSTCYDNQSMEWGNTNYQFVRIFLYFFSSFESGLISGPKLSKIAALNNVAKTNDAWKHFNF